MQRYNGMGIFQEAKQRQRDGMGYNARRFKILWQSKKILWQHLMIEWGANKSGRVISDEQKQLNKEIEAVIDEAIPFAPTAEEDTPAYKKYVDDYQYKCWNALRAYNGKVLNQLAEAQGIDFEKYKDLERKYGYSDAYTRKALRVYRKVLVDCLKPVFVRDSPYNIKGAL